MLAGKSIGESKLCFFLNVLLGEVLEFKMQFVLGEMRLSINSSEDCCVLVFILQNVLICSF